MAHRGSLNPVPHTPKETAVTTNTDAKGRTPADRIAAVQRGGAPATDEQRDAATMLLVDLLDTAGRHGVTIDDLDYVLDLPGGCLDVVLLKTR